jgi:hypothetical protein
MDDPFGELLLTEPDDEQPQMTSREARIARAFEQSKKSYVSETVVTPPGVRLSKFIAASLKLLRPARRHFLIFYP